MNSTLIDTMKHMDDIVKDKMNLIYDISLENEAYNKLYLDLRDLHYCLIRAIKSRYEVEKIQEETTFWQDLKVMKKGRNANIDNR